MSVRYVHRFQDRDRNFEIVTSEYDLSTIVFIDGVMQC